MVMAVKIIQKLMLLGLGLEKALMKEAVDIWRGPKL